MKPLTPEELNEFPPDELVWVMFDKADPDQHVTGPMNLDYELALFAFLEKDDAEHMARLIKKDYGGCPSTASGLGRV
jgi:hypothetical protein